MTKKIYFPNLNGLRFFAALSVMIYHFFGTNALNGHFGVVLFFVLSGFLITYLLLEEKKQMNTISIRKFYFRRILRIWPLYFFILLISTIVVCFNSELDANYFKSLSYFVLFLPNLAFVIGASIPYAGVLWSVGAEEQFYLIWPWIIRKIKKNRLIYIFLFVIVIWSIAPHFIDFVNYRYLDSLQMIKTLSGFMGRMGFGSMATGAILAFVAKYHSEKLRFIFHPIIQVLTLAVTLVTWGLHLLPHVAIVDLIYSILFAIIIGNFALNPKVLVSLENKVFNYLGKISFGLYVYHLMAFAITRYFLSQMNTDLHQYITFSIGIVVTIAFASLSYYLLEKPFLKLKSQKFTIVKSGK